MGIGQTLLLGFIAGVTILIGMPLGRMRRPSEALRVTLNALAVGVLVFLVWDVLSAAWEPIDEGLAAHHETGAGLGSAFGYGAAVRRRPQRRPARPPAVRGLDGPSGTPDPPVDGPRRDGQPGAAPARHRGWSPGKQLALLIAVGHRAAQLRRGPRDRPGRRERARSPWPPCW